MTHATHSACPATESMTFPTLLRRGAAAGAAGGFCAALMQWLVTEPVIRRALVIEDARAAVHHEHEVPLVSRTAQFWAGGVTSIVVGVIFGVVFTVVFARLRDRIPGTTDLARALVLAVTGFGVLTLLPALHIPANPPGVGDHDTVDQRTLIYLLTLIVGVLGIGAVLAVDRGLRVRVTDPVRQALDIAVAVSWFAGALVLLPSSPDTVPADVPAGLLWDFRMASLAQLAIMWLVVGVVFGLLVSTRTRRPQRLLQPTS
jgi:predicted cobalt transporter CbtA